MKYKLLFFLIFVSLLATRSGFAQSGEVRVSGKVTDAKGAEIPGANVSLVGTTTGVITDVEGKVFTECSRQPIRSAGFFYRL
jgi:hypothetical protein